MIAGLLGLIRRSPTPSFLTLSEDEGEWGDFDRLVHRNERTNGSLLAFLLGPYDGVSPGGGCIWTKWMDSNDGYGAGGVCFFLAARDEWVPFFLFTIHSR
jgi:hypothetical protein